MSHPTLHPDFEYFLQTRTKALADLYHDLRTFVWEQYPESNELLYHTHALTSVYSISSKLSDGFCMIPIYNNHLNLGFHKGTLIDDPHQLLEGTGKLIRHIKVNSPSDYRNDKVLQLVRAAIDFSIADMDKPTKMSGQVISKIKR